MGILWNTAFLVFQLKAFRYPGKRTNHKMENCYSLQIKCVLNVDMKLRNCLIINLENLSPGFRRTEKFK